MRWEGGFQGRTNKLVDGCYSFWQGGAGALLELCDPSKFTYTYSYGSAVEEIEDLDEEEDGAVANESAAGEGNAVAAAAEAATSRSGSSIGEGDRNRDRNDDGNSRRPQTAWDRFSLAAGFIEGAVVEEAVSESQADHSFIHCKTNEPSLVARSSCRGHHSGSGRAWHLPD